MRRVRGRRSIALALTLLAAAPAAASADALTRVFGDYRADGRIDPCSHSAGALQEARGNIPNDIEQYAPDFPAALDSAIEARAAGACDRPARDTGTAPAAAAPPPPSGGTRAPAAPAPSAPPGSPPAPAPAARPAPGAAVRALPAADATRLRTGAEDAPAPVILLAAILGPLLLVAALLGLLRWLAWEPRWLRSTQHAVTEAGWRASGAWADFVDWTRPSRPAG